MRVSPFLALASAFLATQAFGQTPTSVVFSTLPPLTPDSIPLSDGDARAFFDSAKNQIVIILPGPQSGVPPSVVRYDLPNRVNPVISWSVVPLKLGGYSYSYSVFDNPQSKQRSSQISVLTPDHDTTLARGDTSPWQFSLAETDLPDRTSTVAMASMRSVSWTDPSASGAKISGLSLGLTSQYLPGFCDFFVSGQVLAPLTPQALALLPPSIIADLQRAISPGIGNVRRTAVCPVFRADTPKTIVASNFYLGIQRLANHGELDSASSYMQQLSSYLREFLSAGGAGALAAPALEPGSALETQIQDAISISLK